MNEQHPIAAWMQLRNLSQASLMEQLKIPEENVVEAGYEGFANVTRMNNFEHHPGYFFFRDGVLVMQYIGIFPPELEAYFTPDKLRQELGEPELELRSRAGKHHRIFVYPQQGVAFSASLLSDEDEVDFVEIFQPTTAEHYCQIIYKEPPKFKR